MLSPARMKRLSVVVLERDERAVLRGLGQLGSVHLLRTPAGPDTAPRDPPDRSEELARCDDFAARIDRLCRSLGLEDLPEPSDELPDLALGQVGERLKTLETRTNEVLTRRQRIQQQWGQVTALLEQVSAYEGLRLPTEQLGRFTFLHFALGNLPAENLETLQAKVAENVIVLPLAERDGRSHLVAVTSRKGRFALETMLEEAGFVRDTLAQDTGEAAETLAERARSEQQRLADEIRHLGKTVAAAAREVAQPLADLRRFVAVEHQILEAEQNFPRTDATALITGWGPADTIPLLRRRLEEMTGGHCVVEATDPDDVPEEEIPVLLRHARLLRPFQALVAGYGLPGYRELEPTLFVAITFLGMFGMMFGDVGHGGVLAVGGLLALLLARSEKARDAGVLLLFAGGSSILFGFIYGSYFGIESLKEYALWADPLEGETTSLLWAAVYIGIGVISLGLILNIVNRLRRGDIVGGLLDRFGVVGGVFYWGSLALVLKYMVFHWLEFTLLIIVPLVVLMLKEPVLYALYKRSGREHHAANLFEATMESVIEVFETVLSYLANTISFIRLAAYAMSHAAILMATFLLAREVSETYGAAGGALGIVIIILGNALAILLEGIIASVQALRLEYYEFFSKFFTGSGRAFKPFQLHT